MKLEKTMKNTKEQIISEHFSKLGKKGATNRWSKISPEQRREHAMKMVEAKKKKLSPDTIV